LRDEGGGRAGAGTFVPGEGRIYDPFTVSLHLTDICNARCVFCGEDSHHRKQDSVRTEDLLAFLEKVANSRWTTVNIHGGEPTIRPDFLVILKRIRELGFKRIILQTNALKMADAAFARAVHEVGVDVFTSGFHGDSSELEERITGVKGGFERALAGFANIKKGGAIMRTTTVVCGPNFARLPAIARVCADAGVDHMNISAMQPGGSAEADLEGLLISYVEARPFVLEAAEYALGRGLTVTLEGFPYCALPGLERHQVDWSSQKLRVLYRGMDIGDFDKFLSATMREKGEACGSCAASSRCGGVYRNYVSRYGWDEFRGYAAASEGAAP